MKKIINYFKKWNWGAFLFFIATAILGTVSNKNIHSFTAGFIIIACICIPLGLLFAWVSKSPKDEDNKLPDFEHTPSPPKLFESDSNIIKVDECTTGPESKPTNDHGDFVQLVWMIEKLRRQPNKCTMNELIAKAKENFKGLENIEELNKLNK